MSSIFISHSLVPTPKRKKESSFAILAEAPISRPTSPRSLPVDIRARRVSPFRGSGFRAETSRHNTPKTSTTNSRANSPPRRRTNSLSRIDKMAQTATLPLPLHILPRLHSPRNFVKENIEGVRELSELNREKNEAEAEKKRLEEEEAILKEMGLLERSKFGSKSSVGSKANSRSNSPSKLHLRSRSNSPSAILHYENIPAGSREIINGDDGMKKPVAHRSRVRTVSKSQPQSQDGSPKNTKIPQRQSSESPSRPSSKRDIYISRKPSEISLNKNQRFISSSASSIHETIRIGSQVHDKRASKSTQNLNISPSHIKGKPPISPGRGGPPPVNKALSTKRLSPIVGTPNKSPIDDLKPNSAKTSVKPIPMPRKNAKTAGNTPATSRINSRQPSRTASREPSPEKPNQRKTKPVTKPGTSTTKPVNRVPSVKSTQKPPVAKPEPKKPISRTNSVKSIVRTPSTKSLNEKPPLKKVNSIKNLSEKSQSINKINEVSRRDSVKNVKKGTTETRKSKMENKNTQSIESMTDLLEVPKQDNETQYDKITNDKNELVILTKKNIISMTTAAITSQPLEVVTKVTNQLPAAFEKAREKGIFERLSSKDSLVGKEETSEVGKSEKEKPKEKEHKKHEQKKINEDDKHDEKKPPKHPKTTHDKINTHDKESTDKNIVHDKNAAHDKNTLHDKSIAHDKNTVHDKNIIHDKHRHEIKYKPIFDGDIKLRPLLPHMLDDPQVERAKQKIEAILKEPEVSPENILTASAKSRELKNAAKEIAEKTKSLKEVADKTKADVKEAKDEAATKLTEIKDQLVKQNEKMSEEIRTEATKIVDSIITPVEEPKDVPDSVKEVPEKTTQVKKDIIEPIITVVNERKKDDGATSAEKVNETLVKGDGEVEVQSSNVSTPAVGMMVIEKKMADGNGSDLSAQSNGGLPQSTSTTPKPPVRTKKESNDTEKSPTPEPRPTPQPVETIEPQETPKDPNFCQRLIKKCKSKCCTCCKSDDEKDLKEEESKEKQGGTTSKLNCCKTTAEAEMSEQEIKEMERAAGKASIQYETETETKRTRKLRDILCGCCGNRRRVADTGEIPRNVAESMSPAPEETGCCGKRKRVQRRDSILSDRPPSSCCNNRLCTWLRGMCRRNSDQASSRRTSMFSKNKSMSPTLPPEDNRRKLDTSLVEHTSMMRGAIPVLPIVLAYFCLICNIIVPGLGTIFSGMFCLCFGIPRFGVHDGAKYRIGSFIINLLVGCGQLFTVLFCLVGWGWSIWWGVIMVKTSRKYRKLKREAEAAEAEAAPPVTTNNHTRA
ncbi:unnamed protein product [Arctia plantaginis]|uniref:Protein stum n=1 Tax=Arctia plantaginis TaxID=874455 RepID=A0A8S1AIU5_ARCPL|nr:unnamed protein product [Arctia plantaginis]